jgi:hypothetical protein
MVAPVLVIVQAQPDSESHIRGVDSPSLCVSYFHQTFTFKRPGATGKMLLLPLALLSAANAPVLSKPGITPSPLNDMRMTMSFNKT